MSKIPYMECGACEEDIPLTAQNTMVVRFRLTPEYDYVLTKCRCGMWNRNFIDDSTCLMLLAHKIPLVEETRAPGEVIEAWHESRGIPFTPPPVHELTTSENRQVEFFAWLLERGDTS